jgi:hypothetical protein
MTAEGTVGAPTCSHWINNIAAENHNRFLSLSLSLLSYYLSLFLSSSSFLLALSLSYTLSLFLFLSPTHTLSGVPESPLSPLEEMDSTQISSILLYFLNSHKSYL